MRQIRFNEIEGIRVGHTEDLKAATGATIIISEEGATVGMDVRGGAPGTRETDLLDPVNLVDKVHAILLAGGAPSDWMPPRAPSRWQEHSHPGIPR